MLTRRCFVLLLTCVTVLLASCSTYQVDFAQAVAAAEVPPASPHGPWQGRWKSSANGHEGPLWCLVAPNPQNPKLLDFRYRAGWGKLQFGDYLHTVPSPGENPRTIPLADSMPLPGGFGTYTIKGTVTATTFEASFTSDGGDHGTFSLRRPN